jgi:hypothetical protein
MTGRVRAAALLAAALFAMAVAGSAFGALADAKPGASSPARPLAASSPGPGGAAATSDAAPIEFEGTLESGKTYVAEVFFDHNALRIWRPVKELQVPRGHAWTITWDRLEKFPALKTPAARARPQRFRFRVEGVDLSSGSPALPWTTVYRCEVMAVEPIAGAPAPAPRRK